ncbi:hypothetical protein [Schlesneria sp. T3-172]|uniref:hypothetical protein n=1 Tax=Schlesneria sphaerica TaxID=3373610 RepID=UPI0037C7C0C7
MVRDLLRLLCCGTLTLSGLVGCQQEGSPQSPAEMPRALAAPPAEAIPAKTTATEPPTKTADDILGEEALSPVALNGPSELLVRPDDRRPQHDEASLAQAGIHLFESKRLKLFTDVPAAEAEPLPQLVDQLYDELEQYFGPLPPDRQGSSFQMTGYLVNDLELFRSQGLLPEEFTFDHGVQRRNEFWVRDQDLDYYRRHLVLHEATHCFMNYMPDVDAPLWYMEGMAEYFATHRIGESGAQFRVMPTSARDFAGFGRMGIIRRDVATKLTPPIPSIASLEPAVFKTADPYAWSWALCAFLDGTPRYRNQFQKLGQATRGGKFEQEFRNSFPDEDRELATGWQLFLIHARYGYDFEHAAIDFQPGEPLSLSRPEASISISAQRGWQSSRVLLEAGKTYEISATGRFTLKAATGDTRAWESDPQGISFRYVDGLPMGTLVGCLRTETGPAGGSDDAMLQTIRIGNQRTFQAPVTGTFYLRLNDDWNSFFDNSGEVQVTLREVRSVGPVESDTQPGN